MRSIIALAMSSSAKISPHLENSMLVVRTSAIRSQHIDTTRNRSLAPSGSVGRYPHSSRMMRPRLPSLLSASCVAPSLFARLSSLTSSAVDQNATSLPSPQAGSPKAIAVWVLPLPDPPKSTRSSWASMKASESMSSLVKPRGNAIPDHSKPSKPFREGKFACRLSRAIRLWCLSAYSLASASSKNASCPSAAVSATWRIVAFDSRMEPPSRSARFSLS